MKTKISLFFLICVFNTKAQTPCVSGFAGTYPCNNINLQARMDLSTIGGITGTMGNDCWGWTDPLTSKEYAIMGCTTHTAFVDITVPTSPVYLGKVNSHNNVNNIWRDVKVYNNYAFIVSEATGHGMQIFDLTRLRGVTTPQVFAPDARYTGFGNCHNIAINEATGFAYCIGTQTYNGGPHVVNIQNPLNPTLAMGYSAQNYTHDAQIVIYNGPDSQHVGKELFFGANETKVIVLDVTDKSNPILISTFLYANTGYTHQGWLTTNQKYFVLGDETDEQSFGFNTKTIVIDMTDLDAPVLKLNYSGTTAAIDHNGYVKGNQFHLANYRAGYRIINMSNIDSGIMNEVGFFDTYPTSNSAQFNGAWSVYPYFPSGNILISDIERGLFIVKPDATLSVNDFSLHSNFKIYPNPTRESFSIDSNIEIKKIAIYDLLGKTILIENNIFKFNHSINTSLFKSGIYILKINNVNTQKLIIE